MTVIEKFLGRCVNVPDELRYDVKQGLWAKCGDQAIDFGLTEPALVLSGGVKDVDHLVDDGKIVEKGESVLFAITGKIMYLETPVAGRIRFNQAVNEDASGIAKDPYGAGWLFRVEPAGTSDQTWEALAPVSDYLEKLRHTEGFKNPEGVKGGVSGMCKAVYSGIGEQKI